MLSFPYMAKLAAEGPFTNIQIPCELRDKLKTWAKPRGLKLKYVVAEALRQYMKNGAK